MTMIRRIASMARRPLSELAYAIAWRLGIRGRAPSAAQRAIFTRIYEQNAWGDAESRSGPGSTRARAAQVQGALIDLFRAFSIRSVVDAPCGDFNWMRDVAAEALESYVGVDIVAELIAHNRRLYEDASRRFVHGDITRDPLPRADAIVCRDALVHFSFADIRAAVANFKRSGSKYLLATSFPRAGGGADIRTGDWRALDLQAAPISFPEPLAWIDDTPPTAPAGVEKRLCLWELAILPG